MATQTILVGAASAGDAAPVEIRLAYDDVTLACQELRATNPDGLAVVASIVRAATGVVVLGPVQVPATAPGEYAARAVPGALSMVVGGAGKVLPPPGYQCVLELASAAFRAKSQSQSQSQSL